MIKSFSILLCSQQNKHSYKLLYVSIKTSSHKKEIILNNISKRNKQNSQ